MSKFSSLFPCSLPQRLMHTVLMLGIGVGATLPAMAQVVSAPDGPRIGQAGNGVPVIDINAANARGISHNRYQAFNVGREGVILNNQTATGPTQLGGYVLGNDKLKAGGAARLIVNEVTGTQRSQLHGYMEVAGQRAGVVVANPNGISCDGCGFLNTQRATLTTGTPEWNADGSLRGYRVTTGALQINGQGLDGSTTDRLELIARALQINAGVWANTITASSGSATVDADTLQHHLLEGTGEKPNVGIDVSALGGMYAGRIRLVGGEHGVGVASAGELIARDGELSIDSAGNLRLTGTTQANTGTLTLRAAGNAELAGTQIASGDLDLQAGGQVRLAGTTQSLAALRVRAGHIDAGGTLSAGQQMALIAQGNLSLQGTTWAGHAMHLDAGQDLSVAGTLQTPELRLHAGRTATLAGQWQLGSVAIDAQSIDSLAQIDATTASVRADRWTHNAAASWTTDQLDLQVRDVLDNRGALLARQQLHVLARSLINQGQLFAGLGLQMQMEQLDNSGRIDSQGAVSLKAWQLRNRGHIVGAQSALQAGLLDNRGGVIASSRDSLQISAALGVDNSDGGRLHSVGALTLDSDGTLRNTGGAIDGGGHLQIRATRLDNQGGRLVNDSSQALDLALSQDLDNRGGTLGSTGGAIRITAGAVDNQRGTIQAGTALSLNSSGPLDNQHGRINGQVLSVDTGGPIDNRQGQLAATGGALHVTTAASLDNRGGTLGSNAGDIHIRTANDLDNSDGGVILSALGLSLDSTGELRNRAGAIDSGAAMQINAARLDNDNGRLVADAGSLQLAVGEASNRGGTLGSIQHDVTLRAAHVDNTAGTLIAGQDLSLLTASLNNRNGLAQAGNALTLLDANALVLNQGGQLLAGGRLQLQAQRLDNDGGVVSAGDVALALSALSNQQNDDAHRGVFARAQLDAVLDALQGDGRLFGGSTLRLGFRGDYTHTTAVLQSNGLLALDVGGRLTNLGVLQSPGLLQIQAAALTNLGTLNAANGHADGRLVATISGALDNRGRIGGDAVLLTATGLTNTGTIIGNDVHLIAQALTNGRDLGQADNGAAPYNEGTIAGVNRVRIEADQLHNLDALIYSGGDVQISGRAGAAAAEVNNVSGQIQAEGDLTVVANRISNRRRVFDTERYTLNAAEQAANTRQDVHYIAWQDDPELAAACAALGGYRCKPDQLADVTDAWFVTHIERITRTSTESQLLAGSNLVLEGDLTNHTSTIAAGGALSVTGRVDNIAFDPSVSVAHTRQTRIWVQTLIPCGAVGFCWTDVDHRVFANSADQTLPPDGDLSFMSIDRGPSLAARMTAHEAVDIVGPGLSNGAVGTASGVNVAGGQLGGAHGPGWSVPGLGNAAPVLIGSPEYPLPNLVIPDNGLFKQQRDPSARYLVETDPRFTEYGQWIASDYLLGLIGHDPSRIAKRLGDGYYEQKLVMDQLTQLTGRSFLNAGIGGALEQYRALMDGAAAQAGRLNLSVGVALTASQVAALGQDMVWLVEQTVAGQQVLVPVLYLSQATADRLTLEGSAAIAGGSVNIESAGAVANRGSIQGVQGVQIDAASLRNSGQLHSQGALSISTQQELRNSGSIGGSSVLLDAGTDLVSERTQVGDTPRITAGEVLELSAGRDMTLRNTQLGAGSDALLSAGNDLRLEASRIDAGGHAVLDAGNDIVLGAQQRTEHHSASDAVDRREISETSGIQAGGHLVISAGNDIRSEGAQLKAGQSMALQAGNDILLGTVTDIQHSAARYREGRAQVSESSRDETLRGTGLSAGQDITLSAGRDATLVASQLRSDQGAISVGAGRDVKLLAGEQAHSWARDTESSKSGLFSSTRTRTHDATQDVLAVGTTLSAEQISIGAGRDITAQGAKIAATGDVLMAAKRHLSIVAAESTHDEQHSSDRRKSGLMSSMNGSFGVTIGSRSDGTSSTLSETIAEGSLIGSTAGSIVLTAGETLLVGGSDVLSNKGTTLLGKDVVIDAAEQQTEYVNRSYSRQNGLNVAVGGASVEQVQSARAVYGTAKRASEVDDERLQALYAVQAAQSAAAVAEAAGNTSGGGGGAGLNVRITGGTQHSRSETVSQQTTHRGSALRSDGDIVIAATGGDLSIIGSQVAGRNVALAAANDLVIRSSEDRYSQTSRNQSQGGEVGVAISGSSNGGGAIGVYVGANIARGKGDGSGTLHNESLIQASDLLSFSSGGNTTLQGAQLTADQVIGQVGGNLTVRSEQDSDRYKSQQLAARGNATIGYGFDGSASGSVSLIDSEYRSVREQTGIAAGEGGFQLHVGGTTHLVGAVIGSTADPSKNLLSTGSLSVGSLTNSAEYLSASVSGSTGGGGNPGDGYSFGAGLTPGLPTGDSKTSTTHSGLADGVVEIRDGNDSALAELQRGVTGLDDGTGFAPIFDEKKVAERQELTQLLGEIGFEAVGNLSARNRKQAKEDLAAARASGDASAEAEALQRFNAWGDGGRNKVLLHGLTGAAVAALSGGDSGAAAAGAAGAELAKDAMIRYLAGQGLDPRSGEFNTLIELASTALGGALGGADGAGTAQLGDRFNRQMHWDQYLEELDSCSSNPGGAGCSAILGMTADTQAVVISDSSEAARYKVIANQSKSTGETVSFTLTEPDGTPRIIMNKDEYNQFVASGMPPFMLGMSPGYGLDYGSALMHVFKGDVKEGIGDLKNVFTSGEYWRDMGLAMITGAAGVALNKPSSGAATSNGARAPPAVVSTIEVRATSNRPLGLGSTGRTTPNSLRESLAMEQAMSNPASGVRLPFKMTDKRWPSEEGWVKHAQNINGIEVHYVRNSITGAIDDFKFK